MARQHCSFLDLAWRSLLGMRWGAHKNVNLATRMVWLQIVCSLDALAVVGTAEDVRGGLSWRDIVQDLDIPEAEARAHVDALIVHGMFWDTDDGCLGLTQDLCLTPAHEAAFVRGWRFVPIVVLGGG
jgi:hypothetical protein